MKVRTRFAPSPTGHLHIGALRAALYNALFARHHKGAFLLRIEDTDQSRTVKGAQDEIVETLSRYGLDFDEDPIRQSDRLDIYEEHADKLVHSGNAYWCTCSTDRLTKLREEQKKKGEAPGYDGQCRPAEKDQTHKQSNSSVLRLRVPDNRSVVFNDIIRGKVSFASKDIDDQVLLKSDGFPTYHLANVVDDHLMEISHVIRGEEWLSSTPKHVLLYEALGWEAPQFAHLPLILSEDGGKLSKRDGAISALDYLQEGYLPEAVINFLALLGWNPRADEEIYTIDELIAEFDLSKVNKGGVVFSEEKLEWIAKEHMKRAKPKRLAELVIPFLQKKGLSPRSDAWLGTIMSVEQQRIAKLSEVGDETDFAFTDSLEYDGALLVWKKSKKEEALDRLQKVLDFLSATREGDFIVSKLEKNILSWVKTEDLGNAQTLWPLRVALTGREQSPSPFEAAALLGKEETLKRIKEGISKL